MHILSAAELPKNRIEQWFDLAKQISEHPYRWTKALEGKLVGALFYEPSTRTRWSTEAAMKRLGGDTLSEPMAKDSSSIKKGESLADTFKTCSQYVDCLIVRHPQPGVVAEAAQFSDVPVINGGDGDNEHPTQALLDLYTILQRFPDPTGKTFMFTGDIICSRTVHSLLKLLEPYKIKLLIEGGAAVGRYKENGVWEGYCGSVSYVYRDEPYGRLPEVDVLYMTRHQTERIDVQRETSKFVMTHALACTMKRDAIIMHPLPRTGELLPEVDKNHRAIYFQQAKNGMWVRMALLYDLLHDAEE